MRKYLTTLSAMALLGQLMCTAQNITGTISCDGKGIADVVVSDGFEVTTTDANGHYQLTSEKKNGYVFYSIPSGYMPKVNPELKRETLIPPFYSLL
ncbi:MAG: metallophosphoesterase N-terminal domain-containing protein, partial [Muribaculaceae bacterium]